LSTALDRSLSIPDAVWRALEKGKSFEGKCNLMQQCKKMPKNASGRNCVLDVTLNCSNVVETKKNNRVKAEAGPSRDHEARNTSSTALGKQHRRSRIAQSQSTKVGCVFEVTAKQWQNDPALYLIARHYVHTNVNDIGVNVHDNQRLSRISDTCKQRVYEHIRILHLAAAKAIVAGRLYSLRRFVHTKPAMVHKIHGLIFLLCYWLEHVSLARNVKITLQCSTKEVVIMKQVVTMLSGVGKHLVSQI
jgi:hypothetical protein